jgi:PST family polysaccharide transporter
VTTEAPAVGRTGRVPALLASRVIEQGVLGLGALGLARALGVERFAPVSILFVLYSLAVTGADYGLGIAVLRHGAGPLIASSVRRAVRLGNATVALVAVTAGALLGGDTGLVVAGGGVLWAAGGESVTAKAVALKQGRTRRAATAEAATSVVMAAGLVLACAGAGPPAVVVLAGMAGKLVVEAIVLRPAEPAFAAEGARAGLPHVWGTVIAAYGISNLDYVVVGLAFSPTVFSIYLLAFRLANALPAQVGLVAVRVSLVDLAGDDPVARQEAYDRYVRRLALAGAAGSVVTIAAAPLIPLVIGHEWTPSVGVVVVLALAVPWRLVLSISGSLALAAGATPRLLRWDLVRLAVVLAALALAAVNGFAWFVATVALAEVLAVLAYHSLAGRATGVRPPRLMVPAAVLAGGLIVLASTAVSTSAGP